MPENNDLAAWATLLRTHAAVLPKLERALSRTGLPLTWYDVLLALAESPERRLRLHELARRVVLSRSGLTRLVDRLEAAGLLRREPDPTDGRGAFAVLTEKGERRLRDARPTHQDGVRRLFLSALGPGDPQRLGDVWERITT